jgi:hypothetical protein
MFKVSKSPNSHFLYTGRTSIETSRITAMVGNPVRLIIPVMYFKMTYRYSNVKKVIMHTVVI